MRDDITLGEEGTMVKMDVFETFASDTKTLHLIGPGVGKLSGRYAEWLSNSVLPKCSLTHKLALPYIFPNTNNSMDRIASERTS